MEAAGRHRTFVGVRFTVFERPVIDAVLVYARRLPVLWAPYLASLFFRVHGQSAPHVRKTHARRIVQWKATATMMTVALIAT